MNTNRIVMEGGRDVNTKRSEKRKRDRKKKEWKEDEGARE